MLPINVVSIIKSPNNTDHPVRDRTFVTTFCKIASLAGIVWIVGGTGCQSIQRRVTQDSARCGALCAKAREARERGNSDQADQFINEALRQKPSDIDSRRQLAETMWNSGRRAEAVNLYTEMCAQHPKNSKLAERLAVMLWEIDQRTKAASVASSVLQATPQSKEASLIKARMEVIEGKLDDALVSYLQLSQLAPDDLTVATELGQLHLQRGHSDRACLVFLGALQNADATDKQRSEIEWLLGVAYARCERWSQALNALEHSIDRGTASAEDWCLLSRVRLECGDVAGAQEDLVRAFTRDPKSAEARKLAERIEISTDSATAARFVTPAGHSDSR